MSCIQSYDTIMIQVKFIKASNLIPGSIKYFDPGAFKDQAYDQLLFSGKINLIL